MKRIENVLLLVLLAVGLASGTRSAYAQPPLGFTGINPRFLPPGSQQYRWDQGQPAVRMMAVNTGICGLTAIGGLFRGGGEHIRIENVNGFWQLSGASQQQGVSAIARCVPLSLFQTKSGINHSTNSVAVVLNSASEIQKQELLSDEASHSWCWVTGFGGKFGQFIGTVVVPHVSVDFIDHDGFGAVITAQASQVNTFIEGGGACASFPGVLQPHNVFGGQGSWRPEDNKKQVRIKMVGLKQGICFFTSVGGDFDSQFDGMTIGLDRFGVQYIFGNAHNWGLAPNFSKTPVATVNCLAYDQR